jgi:hypothetical protein
MKKERLPAIRIDADPRMTFETYDDFLLVAVRWHNLLVDKVEQYKQARLTGADLHETGAVPAINVAESFYPIKDGEDPATTRARLNLYEAAKNEIDKVRMYVEAKDWPARNENGRQVKRESGAAHKKEKNERWIKVFICDRAGDVAFFGSKAEALCPIATDIPRFLATITAMEPVVRGLQKKLGERRELITSTETLSPLLSASTPAE